jgi:hypothetical protein
MTTLDTLTNLKRLLEKAHSEISYGDPIRAEDYINLALDDIVAAIATAKGGQP